MGKGNGISAMIRKKGGMTIATRGSGQDNAKAGFKEVCENFEAFVSGYNELDSEQKTELE